MPTQTMLHPRNMGTALMGGGGTEAAGTQADDGRTALMGGGGTEAAGTQADDGRTALKAALKPALRPMMEGPL